MNRSSLNEMLERRREKVTASAVEALEKEIRLAAEQVAAHAAVTGQFKSPAMPHLEKIMEEFFRNAIIQGISQAKAEKQAMQKKKRLSAQPPTKIPPLRDLVNIFSDHRTWPAILKRSNRIAERFRSAYLKKLEKKFKEIVPRMMAGEASPDEIKKELSREWMASRGRVEVIFRTETTNYFARTQVAYFEKDDEIIGFLFDSVKDLARTETCRTRHGLVYRPGTKLLQENTPALHWHCRSHLIALADTPFNRKLLEDPQRNPALKKVAPLPPGWRK